MTLAHRARRRRLFGADVAFPPSPRPSFFAVPGKPGPASEADYARDLDLGPSCTVRLPSDWPVRSQGDRGTCVAHAAIACTELTRFQMTDWIEPLSEEYIQYRIRQRQRETGGLRGRAWLHEAGDILERNGAPTAAACPYHLFADDGGLDDTPPSSAAEAEARARLFPTDVIDDAARQDKTTAQFLHWLLAHGVPAAISFPIHQREDPVRGGTNWTTPIARSHGIVADPPWDFDPRPEGGTMAAGHAVCLVGYLRDPKVRGGGWFMFRNSWGLSWASEAGSSVQPYAIPQLPGRGWGVMSAAYVNTFCSEVLALTVPQT